MPTQASTLEGPQQPHRQTSTDPAAGLTTCKAQASTLEVPQPTRLSSDSDSNINKVSELKIEHETLSLLNKS